MKRFIAAVLILCSVLAVASADIDTFVLRYNVYAQKLVGIKEISEDMLDPGKDDYVFRLENNTLIYLTKTVTGKFIDCAVYAENMDDLVSCSMAAGCAIAETAEDYLQLAGDLTTMFYYVRCGKDASVPSSFHGFTFLVTRQGNGYFMTMTKE